MSDVTQAASVESLTLQLTLQLPTAEKEWLELEALRLKRELGLPRPSVSAVVRRLIQQERSREQQQ